MASYPELSQYGHRHEMDCILVSQKHDAGRWLTQLQWSGRSCMARLCRRVPNTGASLEREIQSVQVSQSSTLSPQNAKLTL